jgi:hypothetical protein
MKRKSAVLFCSLLTFLFSAYGFFYAREGKVVGLDESERGVRRAASDASELGPEPANEYSTEVSGNADCSFFGGDYDKIAAVGLRENVRSRMNDRSQAGRGSRLGLLTMQVAAKLPSEPLSAEIKYPFEPPYGNDPGNYTNLIDRHIFPALVAAGVPPAKPTNDYEFIRRVTIDLTGRIPTKDRVLSFVADSSTDKRSRLVDELINSPEWLDKWTLYYGDLFQNTSQNTQMTMYQQGVLAMNTWIRDSLANGKPYDQMAR